MLLQAAVSALFNVLVLAGLPFLVYWAWHRFRHKRKLAEVMRRAGLQVGDLRYVGYCALIAAVGVAGLLAWPPSLEAQLEEGSAFRAFGGLGWSGTSLGLALFYGVVKTGFAEELLARGLIAGSLSRRMSLAWANLVQALIFLAPHLLLLLVASEFWMAMPLIFAGALLAGWARIKSGSILGPWLIHAAVNVTTCLSVAVRSAGS